MSSVKDSVDLLLKIIHSFGFSKLEAADFRLAKFNVECASQKMWRLLFEALYCLHYGVIDEVCIRAFHEFRPEEVVVFVRQELQSYGFLSRDLDVLPHNMKQGSRELLLAFGWLLCKENVIGRLHGYCTSPLTASNGGALLPAGNRTEARETLKKMIDLNEKLKSNLGRLNYLRKQQRQDEIAVPIDGRTTSTLSQLSALEKYLVNNPVILKRNITLLEKDRKRLQNLLDWDDYEDAFWRWMESVLDMKINELELTSEASESVHSSSEAGIPVDACEELSDSLIKYENIAELLERQWGERNISVTTEEIDMMIGSIDAQIDIFTNSLNRTGKVRGNQVKEKRLHKLPNTSRNIEHEVSKLEGILAKLETDVENNYANFTKELQTASHATNNIDLNESFASVNA